MSCVQDKGVEEGNHLDIKACVKNTGETSGMKLTEQKGEAEDTRSWWAVEGLAYT